MNKNNTKRKVDFVWEKLFEQYDILSQIDSNGSFYISAKQIKEEYEPRLATKFDHSIELPKIFLDNKLSILPVSSGDYIISHFDAYHKFEKKSNEIIKVSLPSHIQSLTANDIFSESVALNCAIASQIIAHFLQEDDIFATVSGKMSSGSFSFDVNSLKNPKQTIAVSVNNSRMEIDAAYEGVHSLSICEAKKSLSDDFLIRQLYYPFRAWHKRITKKVRPVFLVFSNGIYHLYEYDFPDINNYSTLELIQQKNYSIEDTTISTADIQAILANVSDVPEPMLPFPQADSFERIISLCEQIKENILTQDGITEYYEFDSRQTYYYTDAAQYLGLLKKVCDNSTSYYTLTDYGEKILKQSFKQRQFSFCRLILSHKVFRNTLERYFATGNIPDKDEIISIMKNSNLYNIKSYSTYKRRAQTIKGWVNWIVSLIND